MAASSPTAAVSPRSLPGFTVSLLGAVLPGLYLLITSTTTLIHGIWAEDPNDVLRSFEDLVGWTRLALVTAAEAKRLLAMGKLQPRAAEAACAKVRTFREQLRMVVGPMKVAVARRDRAAAARAIERAIAALRPEVRFVPKTGAIELGFPVRRAEDVVARIVQ